mgnify:FL=1
MKRRALIYLSDDVVEGLAAIAFAHQLAAQRAMFVVFVSPEPLRGVYEPICNLSFANSGDFKIINFDQGSTITSRLKHAVSRLFNLRSWNLVLVAGADVSSSWPKFPSAEHVFFIRSGDGYFEALMLLQLRFWCVAQPLHVEASKSAIPAKTIKSRIMLDLSEPAPDDAAFWAEFIYSLIGKNAPLEGETVLVFSGAGEIEMLDSLAANLPLGQIEIACDDDVLTRLAVLSEIDIWVGSNPLNGYLAHCLDKTVIYPFDEQPHWQAGYPARASQLNGVHIPRLGLSDLSQMIAAIFHNRA